MNTCLEWWSEATASWPGDGGGGKAAAPAPAAMKAKADAGAVHAARQRFLERKRNLHRALVEHSSGWVSVAGRRLWLEMLRWRLERWFRSAAVRRGRRKGQPWVAKAQRGPPMERASSG